MGRGKRGKKTPRHYADALRVAHAELLRAERAYAAAFPSFKAPGWAAAEPLFLEMAYKRFLRLLRDAQRAHPMVHWGYPEG